MLFHVDPHSGVPIFRQLMDQVKLGIASGVLAPGDELPSIRSVSVPLGVNPMTISKAYNILVREEILTRRPGKPLIVGPLAAGELVGRQEEQLRELLRPAVRLARQLEFDRGRAIRLLTTMLDGEDE
jgi:GntR family transcriptional regulator